MLDIIKPYILSYQLENIEKLIRQLPNSVRAIPINITTDCRIDMISCISILWKVDLSIKLNDDIKRELFELENQLRNVYMIQLNSSANEIIS
jgi:hypothetical protein